jgi:hypothetical protein
MGGIHWAESAVSANELCSTGQPIREEASLQQPDKTWKAVDSI